jgi:predicted nucleotide-binding protein with TIR-like domain
MAKKSLDSSKAAPKGAVPKKKRTYVKQTDVPSQSVDDALRVARALADEYGKQPTRPIDVAKAMELTPGATQFKTITGASIAYGFTEGGYNAEHITLTELGRRAIAPTEEGDDLKAKREGFLRPRVINEFMTKYDGSKVPSEAIAENVLESMGVAGDHTQRTLKVILEGAEHLGLLTDFSGKDWVDLGATLQQPAGPDDEEAGEEEVGADESDDTSDDTHELPAQLEKEPEPKKRPNVLFVGHGKNKKPLGQLTGLLDKLKIPYRVAESEPNKGRPIPIKVRETMEQCGASILIFSADEELFDKDGESVWKNSENVGHELGAAAVMYDDRIIIFKEEGVSLASNYGSIGYIGFEKNKLDAKLADLLTELVALKILQVQVGE